MRSEYMMGVSRKIAAKAMPWAVKIVKVCGGYRGFESLDDYRTWKAQK